MSAREPSALSRALVSSLLVGIGIGPLVVDFLYGPTADQHIRNPEWPPHAKFHDAQYIAMSPLISAIGLRSLFRRGGDAHVQLREAEALAAVAWLGMWGALLLPGTAATDPEFEATERTVMGMHPQLFLSLVALGTLSGTVVTEAVRASRRR
jgi:hypothetical protein